MEIDLLLFALEIVICDGFGKTGIALGWLLVLFPTHPSAQRFVTVGDSFVFVMRACLHALYSLNAEGGRFGDDPKWPVHWVPVEFPPGSDALVSYNHSALL